MNPKPEPEPAAGVGPASEQAPEADPNGASVSSRPSRTPFSAAMLGPWAVPFLLVVLFVMFCFLSPDIFATPSNVRVMVGGQAIIVLLAMAFIVPLRAGDFDLSISAVMIMSGIAIGVLTLHGYPPVVAYCAGLLIGPVVGVINGFLVVTFGIDPLIATLGTLTVLTGIARLVSDDQLVTTFPTGLTDFATHRFLGFATPVWAGWIIALVLWYIFELTPLGRYLLFIGGNRNSAKLAGLRVSGLRFGAFVASGTLAALTGFLFAGSLGSVDPASGGAYLLPPITAAFLGASAIKLGRVNVFGTLVAIYLLAVGITGLQLLGLTGWISDVFNGGALILAVSFSILFRRSASK